MLKLRLDGGWLIFVYHYFTLLLCSVYGKWLCKKCPKKCLRNCTRPVEAWWGSLIRDFPRPTLFVIWNHGNRWINIPQYNDIFFKNGYGGFQPKKQFCCQCQTDEGDPNHWSFVQIFCAIVLNLGMCSSKQIRDWILHWDWFFVSGRLQDPVSFHLFGWKENSNSKLNWLIFPPYSLAEF